MKDENFHFGPHARWRSAAKSLGISEDSLNSFPKAAPGMVGDSYTFRSPMKYKSGGKVRELEVEIKFPRMGRKSEINTCKEPIKRAIGGKISSQSTNADGFKKGGIAHKPMLMKMMKNPSHVPTGVRPSKAECKMPQKMSCKKMSSKSMPKNGKNSFHMPGHSFKFLRDK